MNVRLVTYRPTLTRSGCTVNSGGASYSPTTSEITITVAGDSALTEFSQTYVNGGRGTLVDAAGAIYGVIKVVNSSTSITLYSLEITLADTVALYYYPEKGYELELQEAPNISINFQFSDIKNPETRKGSYTQTFKLPFTDANNEFFQNWYNVNLSTLVFSTKTKFSAILFVGTVPQFEGYIQLKAVYQKAQLYEVVLMSNTADLFSAIGEKKLKEVFKNTNGTYSDELNHTYTYENIKASWEGTADDFDNVNGVSLRDTSANVQKVMYPLSVTEQNFFFVEDSKQYLDMSDVDIAEYIPASPTPFETQEGYSSAGNFAVNINQLRPAIQLKTLFKLIMARAGFSYKSTFIDGSYFSKLYMTTGNTLPTSNLPTEITPIALPSGYLEATAEGDPGVAVLGWDEDNYTFNSGVAPTYMPIFQAGVEVDDNANVWDSDNFILTKISPTMNFVNLQFITRVRGIYPTAQGAPAGGDDLPLTIRAVSSLCPTCTPYSTTTVEVNFNNSTNGVGTQLNIFMDISSAQVGETIMFLFEAPAMSAFGTATNPIFNTQFFAPSDNIIKCDWLPYNPSQYDNEVLIPQCIDDSITQKAFLKDIIERFNLVLLVDPDDASNILIEPYDDYLAGSTLKDWTKKLDISKEIISKDTTEMQKSVISLTDLEDVDLMNKSIKEEAPEMNVYGKYYNDRINNDFATGELKNSPIFSPYINQKVFRNADTSQGSQLVNVIAQYEISYKQTDDGIEAALEETKPKLFYYHGESTTIKKIAVEDDGSLSTATIYLHSTHPTTGVISAKSFTKYPVCSPYDIDTNDAAPYYEYELSPVNRSLLWNFAPPQCGDVTVFQFSTGDPSWQKNSLYFRYWRQYLDSFYSTDSRIMEAYFNLNEVDIFDFQFNDEIFVKDSYWRIINIHNYQVGTKASTKVTLLKVVNTVTDTEEGYLNCPYVLGGDDGLYYWFCPAEDPGCDEPTVGSDPQWYITEECCIEFGGEPDYTLLTQGGLGMCLANGGSPPRSLSQLDLPISLTGQVGLKSIMQGKLGKLNLPLSAGANRGKLTQNLLPRFGDDIMIKYKTLLRSKPQVDGEVHRMILVGNTDGNTRGYAYPENNPQSSEFKLPINSNVMIQVKGVATVIGGTSSTYVVGTTESFSYNTAFKTMGGVVTQIGTAGGEAEWAIKESGLSTTATLYIAQNSDTSFIDFGLDDSQTDTKRTWTLIVDFTVQNVHNLSLPYGTDWALYQDYNNIVLMNYDYLVWN